MNIKIEQLDDRSREIFQCIAEYYIETGDAASSNVVCQRTNIKLCPASVRRVMCALEQDGWIYSPHTSAGRFPTDEGINELAKNYISEATLTESDKEKLEKLRTNSCNDFSDFLEKTIQTISTIANSACLVISQRSEIPISQINIVPLSCDKIMVIVVDEFDKIESKIISLPFEFLSSDINAAQEYFNTMIVGKTISQSKEIIEHNLKTCSNVMDSLASEIILLSLYANWNQQHFANNIILKGHSYLLDSIDELNKIQHIKNLMELLENEKRVLEILQKVISCNGMQVFTGTQSDILNVSGYSMIAVPCHTKISGDDSALCVIGKTRMNYKKIIPIMDFTAKMISEN